MKTSRRHCTRRSFLKSTTLTAAAMGLPQWFVEQTTCLAAAEAVSTSPNERPGIALIGCGGQGRGIAQMGALFGRVVAVCDADEGHAAAAAAQFGGAAKYRDFRKLLERSDVDVIFNATPDHWHTLINLAAMKAGKDVYCEKPLTLTIDEGKRLVTLSRQTKRILQTGSQQRSDGKFLLACELIRNGRLGKLQRIIVGLPRGPREGPFAPAPVPPALDWDYWQGQTPSVPYVPQRCHGSFRFWYEYSGGLMTDWGAHHMDIAQWANDTERSGPVEIEGKSLSEMIPDGFTTAAQFRVEYRYANGVQLIATSEAGYNGVRFEGTDGWLYVTRGDLQASKDELIEEPLPASATKLYRTRGEVLKNGEISWHKSDNHVRNLFDCIRSRQPAICEAEIGHRSASVCHLGVISLRLGRKLKWDPSGEKFVDDKEADQWLAREQRKPWSYDTI
jgi:predicted dehydrogenase